MIETGKVGAFTVGTLGARIVVRLGEGKRSSYAGLSYGDARRLAYMILLAAEDQAERVRVKKAN
jgi:hypothetical protein